MRKSEILAWLVIGAIVTGICQWNVVLRNSPSNAKTAAGLQMNIMTRYYIGAAQLFPSNSLLRQQLYQQGSRQLAQTLTSASARLRWAVVAGELVGAQEARRLLDELLRDDSMKEDLREDTADIRFLYAARSPTAPAAARDRLSRRHGWYARLAFSHGLTADHPERQAVTLPAVRTFIALIATLILGGLSMVAGLGLLIAGLIQCQRGTIRAAFEPPRSHDDGPPFAEAFALFLMTFMGGSALLMYFRGGLWGILGIYGIVGLVVIGCLRWRCTGWAEVCRSVGLHVGRGWWREAGAGVAGYLAGLPLLGLSVLAMYFLLRLTHGAAPMHPFVERLSGGNTRTICSIFVMATVIGPIFEEIMFRGILYRHLRCHLGWFMSGLIMSFVFAAIHPQGWSAVPVLMALGFAFGCLREWRDSLIAPVCAHAINNGLVLALALLLIG